jgi:hypothetical protein
MSNYLIVYLILSYIYGLLKMYGNYIFIKKQLDVVGGSDKHILPLTVATFISSPFILITQIIGHICCVSYDICMWIDYCIQLIIWRIKQ